MSPLLIGNIICFIGCLIMVLIGLIKTKRNILLAQSGQFIILGIGNLILGGVTGFVSNIVSMARNMILLVLDHFHLSKIWYEILKYAFCAFQIFCGFQFNNMGLVGWIPMISACIFTFALDSKNEIVLKVVIIVTELLWILYDFNIHSYTSMAFDVFTIVSNFVGIFLVKKARSKTSIEIVED